MHRLINWLISVALILVLAVLLFVVIKGMSSQDGVSDNVVIALIGAITAAITIVGSVFIAQLTSSNEGRKQRQIEARNLKREFYNRFLEQFSRRMAAGNSPAGYDFEENQKFCIEVNRLPLYASQSVVELVNHIASGKGVATGEADFNRLFSVIREDLCDDDYSGFKDLKTIHFQIPNKPNL
ncbi:MAG: hypothetical protein OQK94_04450 [Gammaproteobacteria bacterium]|nr:hypothetical protein [Gammaproteobacteria bacterium]MCW8839479.1 hypothetical protein [Gammaproteobacteria bacterium]MCW8959493.1 hypothetical protein [Gammaproteobacteria bacterium]MCW8973012.1 hypothetical protein [Gammaproteobacteria bacterium]MCW8992944.1 hypothetical protein [Gammaproteobacteria bacterium]